MSTSLRTTSVVPDLIVFCYDNLSVYHQVFTNIKLNLLRWAQCSLDELFCDRLSHRGSGRLDLIQYS
jgi:hypothetical protein